MEVQKETYSEQFGIGDVAGAASGGITAMVEPVMSAVGDVLGKLWDLVKWKVYGAIAVIIIILVGYDYLKIRLAASMSHNLSLNNAV